MGLACETYFPLYLTFPFCVSYSHSAPRAPRMRWREPSTPLICMSCAPLAHQRPPLWVWRLPAVKLQLLLAAHVRTAPSPWPAPAPPSAGAARGTRCTPSTQLSVWLLPPHRSVVQPWFWAMHLKLALSRCPECTREQKQSECFLFLPQSTLLPRCLNVPGYTDIFSRWSVLLFFLFFLPIWFYKMSS